MDMFLGSINVVLFVAIAVALIFKYRQSKQAGFLWLLLPLVLFPLLGLPMSAWIESSVEALQAGLPSVMFPFSLVESGTLTLGSLVASLDFLRHAVWSGFILFGILMLYRQPGSARE